MAHQAPQIIEVQAIEQDRMELHIVTTPPLLVNIATAADLLAYSRNVVYTLLNNGDIQSIGEGRARRVVYQSLLEYIQREAR